MKNLTFAILGGDARQFSLANTLLERGAEVRTYGLPADKMKKEVRVCRDWKETLSDADATGAVCRNQ